MKTKDNSKEIYNKFFENKDKLIGVTLKNGKVLRGIFVSFVHGDEDSNDPFIIKWHFINENDIEKHKHMFSIDGNEDLGVMIDQKDIDSVKFKE